MKTFRAGMDILDEVLTASNLNEIAGAVRDVAALRDRLGPGLPTSGALRCHAESAIHYGQPVVPTAFASDASAFLTPAAALSGHVAVRPATAEDAEGSALWGVALEDAAAGVAFRAAFFGLAAVPVPVDGEGGWLAPDSDALGFTDASTRCRVLWVADVPASSVDGDGAAPFRVAMVAFASGAAETLCPQWRVMAEPPEEEGGDWTLSCAGGTVWIFDAKLTAEEAGTADDANTRYEIVKTARALSVPSADGLPCAAGAVVWRWAGGSGVGEIVLVEGDAPADGEYDVVLAEVEIAESGAPSITQRQIDTIFFTAPSDAEPDSGGEDGGDPEAPPCGNPLNGGGAGADENPLDDHGPDDPSGHDPDDNPLDHEGDGGFTPESSGPGDDPSSQDC